MGTSGGVTDPDPALRPVDADFLALPRHELADAALSAARRGGAEHADLRLDDAAARFALAVAVETVPDTGTGTAP